MDAELAIASKRDRRAYAEEPLPAEFELRILDAGRAAGSERNRQGRRCVVIGDRLEEAIVLSFDDSAKGADRSRCSVSEWIEKADWVRFDEAVQRM